MFWTKCDKLITDKSGKPINCDFSPCPGYAVFAFVQRALTPANPSGIVADCTTCTTYAMPCEIKNGHICALDRDGMYSAKPIKLFQDDFENKCGYWKGCSSSWTDCAEWDENWENCLEEATYYEGCYEVKVYRLTPCYEDFNEFKEVFFGECGMSTDAGIWENGYGQTSLTYEASDCCYNYWDKEAHKRRLAWIIDAVKYGDSYSFSGMQDVCTKEEQVCFELEPGVEECMIDCVEMTTFIFRLYNATFEAGVEIALPEDCDEECYLQLFRQGIATGQKQIGEHEKDRSKWSGRGASIHTGLCFTETINGGGSCYGCDAWLGCACHAFGWDVCELVEFTLRMPEDIYFPKMPKGVKFMYKGRVLTRMWGEKIQDKMVTDDVIPFYGLEEGDCLGTPWPVCGEGDSMTIELKFIEYVW